MTEATAGPLHAFLAGVGRDGRGRLVDDVLGFSDSEMESVHDYIQWLFPLPSPSAAQPHSPVLTAAEIAAIRADPRAVDTLKKATERMLRFYRETRWWLTSHDHNHLRITRILRSLYLLLGAEEARRFHNTILGLHKAAGSPVNPRSLRFWEEAVGE
jgi:hypothetical protein